MLKLCQCCCRGIVCNHCRPPCCPLLFLSESLCDYRVQGRWGLTWINKGLWSRGGSDVTCPADAKKHRCTRSKAQLPFLFTFNRHHHWDRMMPRLMLKWITTRLQASEAALLCKAAEKDLKDFKGVFFFFFVQSGGYEHCQVDCTLLMFMCSSSFLTSVTDEGADVKTFAQYPTFSLQSFPCFCLEEVYTVNFTLQLWLVISCCGDDAKT